MIEGRPEQQERVAKLDIALKAPASRPRPVRVYRFQGRERRLIQASVMRLNRENLDARWRVAYGDIVEGLGHGVELQARIRRHGEVLHDKLELIGIEPLQ